MKICDRTLLQRHRVWDEDRHLQPVSAILAEVRAWGDSALRALTARFDHVTLDRFPVDGPTLRAARARLAPEVLESLRLAAERIEAFHRRQPVASWSTDELGGRLGQRISPLRRVGCYVPGGTAPLPSTVLHTVIPARVAGVREVVVATPPNPAHTETGYVHPAILAAAEMAGATEVLRLGGAQAVAALAYGTESIRPVDKIVGPGNIYVTLAKKLVFGVVGIDGLAGPTETVIIADDSANPQWVAADLLAQAEHDVLASAILLTPSEPLAHAVQSQISTLLESLPRAAIIAETFDRHSGIVLTRDLAEAVALANEYAPEHLCLAVRDPERWAEQITCAGGLFLGEGSFEVLGDYVAGPSHVMPTGGSARFASPLSVLDFVRFTSIIALDPATTARLAPHAARLAQAEQLDAHALAARVRGE
ncbi:MAG: histidinol dehydrogenase [Anaerolineales bacterium]|nr:histidinol dehydrogenase [Anaerolineales bacterium]